MCNLFLVLIVIHQIIMIVNKEQQKWRLW